MHIILKIQKMPSSIKVIILAVLDILAVFLGYYFALFFEKMKFDLFDSPIRNTIIATAGIYVVLLYIFGIYKKIIKYSGSNDYIMLGGMAIFSAAILSLIKPLVIPRTLDVNIIALACILAGIISIAYRVLFRTISYAVVTENTANKKRVLIIGAGQATSQVIKTIQWYEKYIWYN